VTEIRSSNFYIGDIKEKYEPVSLSISEELPNRIRRREIEKSGAKCSLYWTSASLIPECPFLPCKM
jgi:hypothetical protein